MASKIPLSYPGVFASPSDIASAQRAAAAQARESDDPTLAIANEREIRMYRLARSFFIWAFVGLPLIAVGVGLLLSLIMAAVAGAAAGSALVTSP